MKKTISHHNGSAVCREHNIRKEEYCKSQKHIDLSLSKRNIIFVDYIDVIKARADQMIADIKAEFADCKESFKSEVEKSIKKIENSKKKTSENVTLQDVYNVVFELERLKFNYKTKRKDRWIDDYYSKVVAEQHEGDAKLEKDPTANKSYKKALYECIDQIGNNKTVGIDNCENEKAALSRFVEQWNERNPNLLLVGAYLHCDEHETGDDAKSGTVHVHCDYIPLAYGYERGMQLQNGLDKALVSQMPDAVGLKKTNTAQAEWERSERKALLNIAKEMGIDATLDKEEALEPGKSKHENTKYYKERKKETDAELNKYKDDVQKQLNKELTSVSDVSNSIISEFKLLNEELNDIKERSADIELPPSTKVPFVGEVYKKEDIQQLVSETLTEVAAAANKANAIINNADAINKAVEDKEKSSQLNIERNNKFWSDVLKDTQSRVASSQKECSKLEQDKIRKKQDIDLLDKEYSEKEQRVSNLDYLIEEKYAELDSIEARLVNPMKLKDEEINNLQRSLASKKRENNDLSEKLEKAKIDLEDIQKEYYRLDECQYLHTFICQCFNINQSEKNFNVKYRPENEEWCVENLSDKAKQTYAATTRYGTKECNGIDLFFKLLNKVLKNGEEGQKQKSIFEQLKDWSIKQFGKLKKVVNSISDAFSLSENAKMKKDIDAQRKELILTKDRLAVAEKKIETIDKEYVPKWKYDNERTISNHYFNEIEVSRKDVFDNWKSMRLDDAISKAEKQRDERKNDKYIPSGLIL